MRFLPLIPSGADPAPWVPLVPLMLRWEGSLHPAWGPLRRHGLAIHAVHLAGEAPLDEALAVLALGLGMDFLVLPVTRPEGREAGFRLLGLLEALLEAMSGRGVKLALRLEPGAEEPVLELMKEARAEAVGFCWHPGTADPEPLADRLWCGVCTADSDLRPLQALGYRWDMALEAAHPPVLFPAEMPATALGRPVVPDDSLVFGRHWDRDGSQL